MNPTNGAGPAGLNDCWNRIGIGGDGSCPELPAVVHCRNCPVYAGAGHGLLNRETWGDYRAEWTALLSKRPPDRAGATRSVLIFALGGEFLALSTACFREAIPARTVHRLPARRNKILLGLVNVRGEIQLCVSLAALLGIETEGESAPGARAGEGRMLVAEHGKEAWVFPVSRICCTFQYDPAGMRPVPATLQHAQSGFSRGSIGWEGHDVGCLDEGSVFAAVREGIA